MNTLDHCRIYGWVENCERSVFGLTARANDQDLIFD